MQKKASDEMMKGIKGSKSIKMEEHNQTNNTGPKDIRCILIRQKEKESDKKSSIKMASDEIASDKNIFRKKAI